MEIALLPEMIRSMMKLRRHAPKALVLAVGMAAPALARAAGECWTPSSPSMTFSAVSPDRPTDATVTAILRCQSKKAQGAYVRYCVFIGSGSPPGIAPRWMTNFDNLGSRMAYDLYSDPARTQIIGPPPAGGGYPVYEGTLIVPGGWGVQADATFPIYGRVPAGQLLPAGSTYYSYLSDSHIYWAYSNTSMPPSCTLGGSTGDATFWMGVYANMGTGCRLSAVGDLDFGVATDLLSPLDSTSSIVVRCPSGTSWSLALSNGSYAAGATTRRLASAAGKWVAYELYKDAGRGARWGSSGVELMTGVGIGETLPQPVTVYGRVPSQAQVPAGTYTDTVTATLTY